MAKAVPGIQSWLILLLAVLSFLWFAGLACGQSSTPSEKDTALKKLFSPDEMPSDKTAEQFARKYGNTHVEDLIRFLNNTGNPPTDRGYVCFLLGKIKDPRGRDAMIRIAFTPFEKKEITAAEASVFHSLCMGLAFLADPESLKALGELSTKEYWEGRADVPAVGRWLPDRTDLKDTSKNPEQAKKYFMDCARAGLANSRSMAAYEILRTLRDKASGVEQKSLESHMRSILLQLEDKKQRDKGQATDGQPVHYY